MSTRDKAAAAASASSKAADQTLTNAAAEAVRRRIQQALSSNSSPVDHKTGLIKSQATLAPFWKRLQRSQGWLELEAAAAYMPTDSSASIEDIIRNHTSAYVCNPLVRQLRHRQALVRQQLDCRFEFCNSCGLCPHT
jgi:hypothetical protein